MIFTLEALEARHGDSLLLHYGTQQAPRQLLIDGGTRGVFRRPLRDRLLALRDARAPGESLRLRMVMVSHIDDDHIKGILDLGEDLQRRRRNGDAEPVAVTTLWHNSFDDVVGRAEGSAEVIAATGTDLAQAAAPDQPFQSSAIFQSVPQGRSLRNLATDLGWLVNDEFRLHPGRLVMVRDGQTHEEVSLGDDLTFLVLGPREDQIRALQKRWDRELQRKGLAAAASSQDTSVFNLASIVVLACAGGRSMLLTGDARHDHIRQGLEAAELLSSEGRFHCDLLKMPHHGSSRNIHEDFFRDITADHYVFSANGRHDNPDLETLELLSNARGEDRYTVWLTNPVPHAVEFYARDQARSDRGYAVEIRSEDDPGVSIHLGEQQPIG